VITVVFAYQYDIDARKLLDVHRLLHESFVGEDPVDEHRVGDDVDWTVLDEHCRVTQPSDFDNTVPRLFRQILPVDRE